MKQKQKISLGTLGIGPSPEPESQSYDDVIVDARLEFRHWLCQWFRIVCDTYKYTYAIATHTCLADIKPKSEGTP